MSVDYGGSPGEELRNLSLLPDSPSRSPSLPCRVGEAKQHRIEAAPLQTPDFPSLSDREGLGVSQGGVGWQESIFGTDET